MQKKKQDKCACGGKFELQRGCGAMVCDRCDNHQGFERCFCGWAADGGNGYQQLLEEGEQIEDDY